MVRCGIDLLEVARVERSLNRFGERFLNRFFTPLEIEICGSRAERLAARIAGKEAVAKVLGTGIGDVRWRDIEIGQAKNGRPVLILHGHAREVAAQLGINEWDISLTHTTTLASAMCVAQSWRQASGD
jgi:holo-[acyl-carrier protein] synthase